MKTSFRITALIFLVFFLSTSLSFARPRMNQDPDIRPMWWHNQQLSQKLDITEEQQDKLEAHLQETHLQMIDLKANVEKALFTLEGALGKNFNEQVAQQKLQAYLEARNDMVKARMATLLATRKILTFEQFRNLRNESKRYKKGKQGGIKGQRQRQGQTRP